MNILLFTDMPPCDNYTAGIVLKHLCGFLIDSGHKVSCYAVVAPDLNPEIPEEILKVMPYKRREKPRENWGASKYGTGASYIFNNYIATVELPKIAREAAEFGKENGIDLIWSVVQGQTMIKLVRRVSRGVNKPYVAQVWDPPEWWLRDCRFDKYTTKSVLREFSNMLRESQCCLAASWSMSDAYTREHGARCVAVVPGLDQASTPIIQKEHTDEFIIAFAGQMYAQNEWNALIDGLDEMNWEHNGRRVRIKLYGRAFHLYFNKPANIEVYGWLKQDQTLQELAKADLLYCPYWFDPMFEKEARLSFPSKLTSYLTTGKPVLFHGPQYASPRQFLEKHNAGYICDSLDSKSIANTLRRIIGDTQRAAVGERGYQAYKSELTFEAMRNSFFKALGIK